MKPEEALNRAAAYCSRQERCVYDVECKLEAWNVDPDEFGAIIERLKKEKFIDEERYATFFVRDKFRFNGWGKVKIRWALKKKNVDPAAVAKALDVINQDEYKAKLKQLILNKYKQLKEPDSYKATAKLMRFARSRGFEPELIYPEVENVINGDHE